MSDQGHIPGKGEDYPGPLTAQEVNLLQYNELQLRERVAELEGDAATHWGLIRELQAQLERAKAYGVESDDNHRYIQAEWKRRYEALQEATDGEAWAWVGDGSDGLDSMSDEMVVAIGAGQLRELANTPKPAEPRPVDGDKR